MIVIAMILLKQNSHDIKVNYSSSDPEHTVTDRHFYIYNEADSLVQHISTSEKTPTPIPYLQGKYKLIAFENIGSNIKNTENYNTITIEQSLTGEQDIFMAKAYLEMPTEYHTVYCYFRRVRRWPRHRATSWLLAIPRLRYSFHARNYPSGRMHCYPQ